ncbi:MAG: trypsin-like peptidase domain-containing protein [Oceanicaulis sp.]
MNLRRAKDSVQTLAILLIAAALIAGGSAWFGARLATAPAGAPASVRAAAASVVTLYAERPAAGLAQFDPLDGPAPEPQIRWRWRTASGFAFAPGGWIVTNHHAVAGARTLEAELADGTRVAAQVHALDPRRDLAVIRLTGASPLPLRPSAAIAIGDPVYALGAPFDLAGSLSAGIVSGFDRSYDGVDPIGYLQHDAALNPGNSGGPLLDRRGRVAGLNTAVAEPAIMNVGVSFAIPSAVVFEVAERLRRDGAAPAAHLGVAVRSLDQALGEAMGLGSGDALLIDTVEAGSPAAAAGLAVGDLLLSVDGAPVGLPRDINRALLARSVGDAMTLSLRRGGARLEARVVLAEGPSRQGPAGAGGSQGRADGYGLRFAAGALPGDGAVVDRVQPASPASLAGFRAGDRVLAVNGRIVADGLEARLRLDEAGPAAAIRVLHEGESEPRHVGLARAASQALSAPGQTWPDAAGGPY